MVFHFKKIITMILITILFLISLGCKEGFIALEPSQYDKDDMCLYTIAAYSIPYADKMGTKIISIEEDRYGRILFEVEFGSSLFYHQRPNTEEDEYMHAFIISQKTNQERAYYYEDDCFRIYSERDDFTMNEQIELKAENDWNQPLQEEKMTSKVIISPGDNKLSSTVLGLKDGLRISMRLDDLFAENESMNKPFVFSEYLDCDQEGKSIGVVWGYSKNENDELEIEAYFIMVEKDCLTSRKARIAPIHDTLHFRKELKAFKKENGWH